MRDHIAKQAYDKGFDAGALDKYAGDCDKSPNPYRKPSPTRNTYYAGYSRYELWDMGYEDGRRGSPRKMSQAEADHRKRERLELLETFRSRVLNAFALHRLHCDCAGITHEVRCPLGELEVEADAIWRGEAVAS